MNVREISVVFDTLYNNIASNQAPGLNEYEKSLFLTKAQYELVKNYFNPKGNKYQEGFDGSPKRQADFSTLVKSDHLTPLSPYPEHFSNKSKYFVWKDDIFIILSEQFTPTISGRTYEYTVVPISFDEYARLMQKPYKYPPKNQVWRLITGMSGTSSAQTAVELIGKFPAASFSLNGIYSIRYVKKPEPIILKELTDDLTIDGKTAPSTGSLPEHMHTEVIQRAVELAKTAWTAPVQDNIQTMLEVGQRSE